LPPINLSIRSQTAIPLGFAVTERRAEEGKVHKLMTAMDDIKTSWKEWKAAFEELQKLSAAVMGI
jgi:hypothetical protein